MKMGFHPSWLCVCLAPPALYALYVFGWFIAGIAIGVWRAFG